MEEIMIELCTVVVLILVVVAVATKENATAAAAAADNDDAAADAVFLIGMEIYQGAVGVGSISRRSKIRYCC